MRFKKVLLPVDVFSVGPALLAKQLAALSLVLDGSGATVEPVYIACAEDTALFDAMGKGTDEFKAALATILRERLDECEAEISGMTRPTILFSPLSSARSQVKTLLEYAELAGHDLIVVCSHSRRGVQRFFLGSFAEALSSRSRLPILVASPRQRIAVKRSGHILFPTNLDAVSKQGLHEMCRMMGESCKRITLFHQTELRPLLKSGPFSPLPIPHYVVEEEWQRRYRIGTAWAEELKKSGIPARFAMEKRPHPAADSIIAAAALKKVELIAMVSEMGPMEAAFLGSTTREVMRRSTVPVWVIHVTRRTARKHTREDKTRAA